MPRAVTGAYSIALYCYYIIVICSKLFGLCGWSLVGGLRIWAPLASVMVHSNTVAIDTYGSVYPSYP
jgi:hypothetical protein